MRTFLFCLIVFFFPCQIHEVQCSDTFVFLLRTKPARQPAVPSHRYTCQTRVVKLHQSLKHDQFLPAFPTAKLLSTFLNAEAISTKKMTSGASFEVRAHLIGDWLKVKCFSACQFHVNKASICRPLKCISGETNDRIIW